MAGGSGQTVFIESATGVGEGARTGLASVVTGLFFAACLFFTPLTAIVPQEVASAALVVIGAMMLMNARHVDWADRATAIPVFLTVVLMPFTYTITTGVAAGVISYVAIKAAQGKAREIGAFMWGLTAVFLVYFALNPDRELAGRPLTARPDPSHPLRRLTDAGHRRGAEPVGSSRAVTSPSPPWWPSAAAPRASPAPPSRWTPTARRSARSPAGAWRVPCTSCAGRRWRTARPSWSASATATRMPSPSA